MLHIKFYTNVYCAPFMVSIAFNVGLLVVREDCRGAIDDFKCCWSNQGQAFTRLKSFESMWDRAREARETFSIQFSPSFMFESQLLPIVWRNLLHNISSIQIGAAGNDFTLHWRAYKNQVSRITIERWSYSALISNFFPPSQLIHVQFCRAHADLAELADI